MPPEPSNPNSPNACPICGGTTRQFTQKTSHGQVWEIRKCNTCGHGFVANRPSLEKLKEIYSGDTHHSCETPESLDLESRVDCRTLAADITKLSPERGRSLDIGCGNGGFSYHLAKQGYKPTLIDLDPRAQRAATAIPGAEFHLVALEDFADKGPFSAIIMSQVLEHALDPLDWLKRSQRVLSPKGVLAVAVPNFGGVYGFLGARDPFLIPPVHLNFFTPRSLNLAFEKAGLRPLWTTSRSELTVSIPGKKTSLKRRIVGGLWNTLSLPLNLTTKGIILRGYAGV